VPPILVRHVAQMKALQQTVIGLTVRFEEVPRVDASERADVQHVADGLWHVTVRYGFVEVPDLAAALASARDHGCPLDLEGAIYFAAHDDVVRSDNHPRLSPWRRLVFTFLYRNALRAPERFKLPSDRFLEIARQVAL
jgi:KUP system potassium uptake protein